MLSCEIESDRPFTLKWYKNGNELDPKKYGSPWHFAFDDNSGLSLVQWPYIRNLSRGLYKCVGSNGHDPDVQHEVRFTPIKGM